VRATRAAVNAIAELGDDATLVELRAAATEASRKVCAEYEAWTAAEGHRQTCENTVERVFYGDDAREAVRQVLEKLPIGVTRSKMETPDAALAPLRASAEAAAQADDYLSHVNSYIEELGNESTGEWDLGSLVERHDLATKLKFKLRPCLSHELLEEALDKDEAHTMSSRTGLMKVTPAKNRNCRS
jgi:hypothetical protein